MKRIQHVSNILNGFKTLALITVIALSAVVYVTSQTDRTAAFLSTRLDNIKMGVGAGEWMPPEAPQLLTFSVDGSDESIEPETLGCDSVTRQSAVTLSWSPAEVDKGTVKTYFVGSQEDPYAYELDGKTTELNLELAEGTQSYQVIAADNKQTESAPSERCAITLDTVAPEVSFTQPSTQVLGDEVSFELSIDESSELSATELSIIDAETEEVVATADLETTTENDSTSYTYLWDSSQQQSGQYVATATVTDAAGNTTTADTSFELDLDAPTSTLSMDVPVSTTSGLITNGSFESGLTGWQVEGEISLSGLSQTGTQPQQGSVAAVLGGDAQQNQVTVLSQDLATVTEQVGSIGFWYYLDPVSNPNELADGMMVFIGEEMVYEDWFSSEQTVGWKYVSIDTTSTADASISVAYYQDGNESTTGELYLDAFATNQDFSINDISLTLEANDQVSDATVVVEYRVDQVVTHLEEQNSLTFQLDTTPDDQLLTYWSYDAVENAENAQTFYLPILTDVTVGGPVEPSPSVTPSPSPLVTPTPSPSPQATDSGQLDPSARIEDQGNNAFTLILENFPQPSEGEYTVVYSHGNGELIQEAVQGTYQVAEGEDLVTVDDLYFGTCSSTAGTVCSPHLNVQDILVEILNISQEGRDQYQFSFPGLWESEQLESSDEVL